MNKKQSNKLNAYMSVKGVLDKHGKKYSSVPMLAQTVGEFFVLLDEIKEVGVWTEMDTTGETSAKLVAKDKLASLASRLAASGMAYAFDRSDAELEAALDYAFYKIRYARDSETLQISGAIATELLNHRANLAGYMVTEEHLADLQRHIEKFREASEIKGGVKSRRVADTKRLVRLFKSTDDLLYRKMDKLMIRLKTDYPDFFTAYRSARKIVDL
jgi:hypothetical protein